LEERRIVAGRFRIVRELGRGGMGAVFEAINLATGRGVAESALSSPPAALHHRFLAVARRRA
jgi:hypothetical protein